MINTYQLEDEINTAMEWLECPYKAPEQIAWARGFLDRIKEEFGVRGADLLADRHLLAEKVADYNNRNPDIWYAGTMQKISSNNSESGDDPILGYFRNYPQVGKRFEFIHDNKSRILTTSPVKSISNSSDGRNLIIETTNSTYDLYIAKGLKT